LRDSGSMTRQTWSGQRRTVPSEFWCVASFYKVRYEHTKRDELGRVRFVSISWGMFLRKISKIGWSL